MLKFFFNYYFQPYYLRPFAECFFSRLLEGKSGFKEVFQSMGLSVAFVCFFLGFQEVFRWIFKGFGKSKEMNGKQNAYDECLRDSCLRRLDFGSYTKLVAKLNIAKLGG